MRTITSVLVLLVLAFGAGAAGAATRATLVGTLLDGEGAPLRGVDVTVRGGGFEKTVKTDREGRFEVRVPDAEAEYEIRFEREGFPDYSEPLRFASGGVHGKEWTISATASGSPTASPAALQAFKAGVVAHNRGDQDLALKKLDEAVAEDPEFTDAHVAIAGVRQALADHEQAAAAAARALALEPEHAGALRILYDAQRELGDEGAGATLDRLAKLDPGHDTAVLVYNEGVAARVAGDRDRARARYELATRTDPSLVEAHSALAGLLLELKEYDAALAMSERTLELDPQDARGNSIRYNTLIAMGRNEEAKAALEELQRVAPGAVAQAYFERGTLLFDDGLIEPAVDALELAVSADPRLAGARYKLGLCYMNLNRNADARRHLEAFLELAPGDPDANAARQLVEVLERTE